MADSPDWTDETLRPLDELARLAFPDGGVTAKTLKLRARQGKLAVYRPGKAYLASLSGVRVMIEKTRVLSRPRTTTAPDADRAELTRAHGNGNIEHGARPGLSGITPAGQKAA